MTKGEADSHKKMILKIVEWLEPTGWQPVALGLGPAPLGRPLRQPQVSQGNLVFFAIFSSQLTFKRRDHLRVSLSVRL